MSAPLLEVQNLTRRFGGLVATSDVSLSVKEGEILGLIGPNGAGKSTLFNMIAGLYPPSEGRIYFAGRDITKMSSPQRCALGIARTFQVVRSFDSMSVIENVIVGALVRLPSAAAARRRAKQVLDLTGMARRAEQPAIELTPPEKRRLEIARALATGPKLLLLDEALTGLTPAEAREGVELVRRIRNEGVTLIIVLNLGKVLAEGPPKDVVRNEAVIGAYLGDRHRA
jgi:branched-chain amino acid transport system ATP-binding protein